MGNLVARQALSVAGAGMHGDLRIHQPATGELVSYFGQLAGHLFDLIWDIDGGVVFTVDGRFQLHGIQFHQRVERISVPAFYPALAYLATSYGTHVPKCCFCGADVFRLDETGLDPRDGSDDRMACGGVGRVCDLLPNSTVVPGGISTCANRGTRPWR